MLFFNGFINGVGPMNPKLSITDLLDDDFCFCKIFRKNETSLLVSLSECRSHRGFPVYVCLHQQALYVPTGLCASGTFPPTGNFGRHSAASTINATIMQARNSRQIS